MSRRHQQHRSNVSIFPLSTDNIANIYSQAGDAYLAYADGDPERLFAFDGLHAYADRRVWSVLKAKLRGLWVGGAKSISILDVGCGPGTWLRRIVTHARGIGFKSITARGFDIAEAQIHSARRLAHDLTRLPGVDLAFEVADLRDRLPEPNASVDLTLCLYGVLSHLRTSFLEGVAAELARVTKGHFIATVRSVGSPPTIFIDSIDKARHFQLDIDLDRCRVQLRDGRMITLNFHLFTSRELRDCFGRYFQIDGLCGLDIFHTRFAPDRRWNPASLEVDAGFMTRLAEMEEIHAGDPSLIDRAAHLLLIASPIHSENELETRAKRF